VACDLLSELHACTLSPARGNECQQIIVLGLPQVRKWSGKKILQGQGNVREFYFEAGEIDILKKSQGNLK